MITLTFFNFELHSADAFPSEVKLDVAAIERGEIRLNCVVTISI